MSSIFRFKEHVCCYYTWPDVHWTDHQTSWFGQWVNEMARTEMRWFGGVQWWLGNAVVCLGLPDVSWTVSIITFWQDDQSPASAPQSEFPCWNSTLLVFAPLCSAKMDTRSLTGATERLRWAEMRQDTVSGLHLTSLQNECRPFWPRCEILEMICKRSWTRKNSTNSSQVLDVRSYQKSFWLCFPLHLTVRKTFATTISCISKEESQCTDLELWRLLAATGKGPSYLRVLGKFLARGLGVGDCSGLLSCLTKAQMFRIEVGFWRCVRHVGIPVLPKRMGSEFKMRSMMSMISRLICFCKTHLSTIRTDPVSRFWLSQWRQFNLMGEQKIILPNWPCR